MTVTASVSPCERHPCELIDASSQLTTLPAAVPELLAALSDDDLSFHELAKIIGQFPSIAARLIFLANSAWAAPVTEITSLEMACTKLGLAMVKSVSISVAIAAPFDPAKCPPFRSEEFWSTALLVADGASWLAEHAAVFGVEDTGSVQTAALLHNLGLLWMADSLPEETASAVEMLTREPGLSLAEALRRSCGADYAEVGGCLARAWSFPALIESAMQNHLDFTYDGSQWEVALVTGYAAKLVHYLGEEDVVLPDDLRLQRLGISSAQRDAVFERLQQRNDTVREMVQQLFC